ncbi:MAG: DUF4965 domain-containing protein [Lachnospiraceae bacterium]|nr:DUF4965 domain-containing protein [Lachnospiraceae bacterium]
MKLKRAASIPLVLHDPFFSVWSSADHLYDADPVHWTGIRQQMRGYVKADKKVFSFLGDREFHDVLEQKSVEVTATATEYIFENELLKLKVRFTSPLLPEDMLLVSRPCTYVDFEVEKKQASEVELNFEVSADLVRQNRDAVIGFVGEKKNGEGDFSYASMGRAVQQPLGSSGDRVVIDWGYVYMACAQKEAELAFDKANEKLTLKLPFAGADKKAGMILAYDDLLSINYFGQWRKAYWTKEYATILDAIGAAFADREEVLKKAAKLDREIEAKALEIGGEDYAFLCNMSFRHAFAAHKLITDENGEIVFLSKENDSNGCIGTVDVSYPSVPLFLLYDTEYVKGMLRPVFKMAASDVWEYDFAPHDVGRYPYAWGQVYGLRHEWDGAVYKRAQQCVYPPFYLYPAGADVFDFKYQMPVEECGNMLIMMAEVCERDNNADFARAHWDVLSQWKDYLLKYGADPGDQLCTDDFAGRLSHNVNLSVKAIMGVEAYAKLCGMLGDEDAKNRYHEIAKEMAQDWEKRADVGDHYCLTFDKPDTWSLKYNLVWDKIWGSGLFSDTVYEKELAYYEKMTNQYGVPLDSRADFTKSDWILWCASMAKDRDQAIRLLKPVANYLENSESRVAFSDWYDTKTGNYCHFIGRSVQGGIFMPMLLEK